MRKIIGITAAICCLSLPVKANQPCWLWYGPGFHGRTTANGEKYDMHGFTAAHKPYLSAQS